ncbi:MAG: ATP-grasp domain-containing protein [Methanomicrobiales archaeon]|nr:ATP-grasp domain-containing protein [Methanomicrobiales archaeon]MDI6877172.1 ATP-grasp domain-containing protein [Methanomicrobiales archaeon]
MNAIVCDANLRTALYAIRSLGRRNIDVTAVEEHSRSVIPIGFRSVYCKKRLWSPRVSSEEDYIAFLLDLADAHDAILPAGISSMVSIAKHLDLFDRRTRIPIPPYNKLMIAIDKEQTFRFALDNDIPCPATYFPADSADIVRISREIEYPAVIKVRRGSTARGVEYAASPQELIDRYERLAGIQERPIIQEYIRGQGYGAFAIYNRDSKPRAVFVHRRLREYPISGGPCTYCESVENGEILQYGLKLLDALKWYGIAMVEFKLDQKDGVPKLIEVNPRFWGSMSLAIHAGVDFPYLLYRLAVDGDIEPAGEYAAGIRTRFVLQDIIACMHYFRKTRDVRYLKEIVGPFFDRDVKFGIFSADDPMPAFHYGVQGLSRYLR